MSALLWKLHTNVLFTYEYVNIKKSQDFFLPEIAILQHESCLLHLSIQFIFVHFDKFRIQRTSVNLENKFFCYKNIVTSIRTLRLKGLTYHLPVYGVKPP